MDLLNFESFSDFAASSIHALRAELIFILVSGLVWLLGRASVQALSASAQKPKRPRALLRPSENTLRSRKDASIAEAPSGDYDPARTKSSPVSSLQNIINVNRSNPSKSTELLTAALASGQLSLRELQPSEYQKFFLALLPNLIRAGCGKDVLELLAAMRNEGQGIESALVTSMMKLATSRQMYKEALEIYDFVAEDKNFEFNGKTVWSCLIFCTLEVKQQIHRCKFFFKRLQESGSASDKDYGNMVRYGALIGDWQQCLRLMEDSKKAGVPIDNVCFNTALAACVGAGKLDVAKALLEAIDDSAGPTADVVTYNTVAKGFVKCGRMDSCHDIFQLMHSRNVTPSQVTYGILLDGYISENQVSKAAEVFEMMQSKGCQMNTVLYTTLIKGFARAGQVDRAMDCYKQMLSEPGPKPDLVTFSVLVKANCDSGKLGAAFALLAGMKELNLSPDEVIFNNLIAGCVKEANFVLGRQIYKDMIASGATPSNVTFSVMIQLYTGSKMFDEAIELLRTEPLAHGVEVEPRLYSQLLLSILRQRQGRRATEVHALMLQHGYANLSVHKTMLGMAVRLNMIDTGADLLRAAVKAGAPVAQADALEVLEAAVKRKKPACIEACRWALEQLSLCSEKTEVMHRSY